MIEDRVEDLFSLYLKEREAGAPSAPEELCRDCPELLPELVRRIQAFRKVETLAGSGTDPSGRTPGFSGPTAPQFVDEGGTEAFAVASVLSALGSSIPETRVYLRKGADTGPQPSAAELSGDSIKQTGRYQIVEEVARGGMGAVFKVRDTDLCRDVAIKVLLRPHTGATGLIVRFVEEAQIGGQLQHPGIVPVYELGTFADGRPYFSMKLVKGRTLSALLVERADPSHDRPRFLKVFEQVCQTLAYAHSRGVIHRDLKPANVMVGAFGEVQVMDWGLAKVLLPQGVGEKPSQESDATVVRTVPVGSDRTETQAGSVMGTPAYMPPEQALGEIDRLDERADVFGLGAMLCEILTGRPPYTGADGAQVHRKALRGDTAEAFVRLSECGADADLVALTRRCLSAEPEDRPRDAGELTRELTGYLESVEGRLRQAELASAEARTRVAEERKRRKLTVAFAGAILGLVLMGGGFWYHLAQQRAERERVALARQVDTERQARDALGRAVTLEQRARETNDGAKWAEARVQVDRAAALVADLPDGHELTEQVKVLTGELEQEEKDRRLLRQLEEVWLLRADVDAQAAGFALRKSLRSYPPVFSEHGLVITDNPSDAAAWVRRRPLQPRELLVAGLDAWLGLARQLKAPEADWLFGVLQAADTDDWRKELRAAVKKNDAKEVERLAKSDALVRQPAQTVLLLADYFRPWSQDRTIELLRQAQARFPADFWINFALANALCERHFQSLSEPDQYEDAVRFFTTASALRSDNVHVRSLLSWSLWLRGRRAEGKAAIEQVTSQQSEYPGALCYLGLMLLGEGADEEAERAFRRALEIQPQSALGHFGLGTFFWTRGEYAEAILALRQSILLEPSRRAFLALAAVLASVGRMDEGITVYDQALRFQPDFSDAQIARRLMILINARRPSEAATIARGAAFLRPKLPEAHLILNRCLLMEGRFADALPVAREALERQKKGAVFPANVISRMVRETEQCIALEPQIEEYILGQQKAHDTNELSMVIMNCYLKQKYFGTAQIYSRSFATDPKLTEDVTAERRFDAARYAAMTAAGLGDAAKLDATERTRWREQAVAWLRADLADWDKWLQAHPGDRALVRERLRWWQQDPKFAGFRDADPLAKLSLEEQANCRKLWADVADVLARASRE